MYYHQRYTNESNKNNKRKWGHISFLHTKRGITVPKNQPHPSFAWFSNNRTLFQRKNDIVVECHNGISEIQNKKITKIKPKSMFPINKASIYKKHITNYKKVKLQYLYKVNLQLINFSLQTTTIKGSQLGLSCCSVFWEWGRWRCCSILRGRGGSVKTETSLKKARTSLDAASLKFEDQVYVSEPKIWNMKLHSIDWTTRDLNF